MPLICINDFQSVSAEGQRQWQQQETGSMIIRSLTEEECVAVLDRNRLGRLACARDGEPYLATIHYVHAQGSLYAFSLPGRKIDFMRANPRVSMLIEEKDEKGWRSVVVNGRFEELPNEIGHKKQREQAWQLLSQHENWWLPGGLKPVLPVTTKQPHLFFRIAVEEMSGRLADREAE